MHDETKITRQYTAIPTLVEITIVKLFDLKLE